MVVAFEAVSGVWEFNAVFCGFSVCMLLIEALQTEKIRAVRASYNGRCHFTLRAHTLFVEHEQMVQSMSSGVCSYEAAIAQAVVTRCAYAVSKRRLTLNTVQ
jgi:hypothetical protein